MNDLENSLPTQLFAQDNARIGPALGLTILWHPDPQRIGDQYAVPASEGRLALSRSAPLFVRPGHESRALAHRAIARAPAHIVHLPDDAVEIVPPDSAMPLEINGAVASEKIRLDRADIARGVVLGLGGKVLLCLHWMNMAPKDNPVPGFLGVSSGAIATRELIHQVAATDLAVLLLGETGTGKDVAARAIHAGSSRSNQPLVAVNMATLNEALAPADLFGALKGAYTGSQVKREGLFAEADGGTLFLDELGDTPASVQPMLLRVLETGRYRPLGASRDLMSSARLIAATDQDLDAKGFNQPLLRRMEAFVIRVPTLRERREDIGMLLLHALQECGISAAELASLPASLVSAICHYDWPGNVRQLANVARRTLIALRAGQHPTLGQFVNVGRTPRPNTSAGAPAARADASPASPRRKLAQVTSDDLLKALESHGWQISGAAQALGISRPSLYKLIEAHPAIRPAAMIPVDEISTALREFRGDLTLCASYLKTPSEALRRHMRVLGLEPGF